MNNDIIVLTLLIIVFPNYNECHPCRQTNILVYDCTYLSLTDVPQEKFDEVFKLDLSYNQIKTLQNDTFLHRDLVNIGILFLQDNNMTSIEVNAFRGMTELDFLNLNNNEIVEITGDLFKSNRKLRFLRFENNNHLQLPSVGFNLPELNILDLENCGLDTIPSNFFSNMTDLEKLYLRRNKLSYLDPELIRPLIELEFLDLRDNLFIKLQTDILRLPLIFEMSYNGNPLLCDCSLLRAYALYRTKALTGILYCQYEDENITVSHFEGQTNCSSLIPRPIGIDSLATSYSMVENLCYIETDESWFANHQWLIVTLIIVITSMLAAVAVIFMFSRKKGNTRLVPNRFQILRGEEETRDSENEAM